MAGQTKDGTKKKQLALTCLQFHNAHCAMCTALCIVRGGLCSYCILVICGIFSYEIGEVTLNNEYMGSRVICYWRYPVETVQM